MFTTTEKVKNLINSLCEHYDIQAGLAYYEADTHDEQYRAEIHADMSMFTKIFDSMLLSPRGFYTATFTQAARDFVDNYCTLIFVQELNSDAGVGLHSLINTCDDVRITYDMRYIVGVVDRNHLSFADRKKHIIDYDDNAIVDITNVYNIDLVEWLKEVCKHGN